MLSELKNKILQKYNLLFETNAKFSNRCVSFINIIINYIDIEGTVGMRCRYFVTSGHFIAVIAIVQHRTPKLGGKII